MRETPPKTKSVMETTGIFVVFGDHAVGHLMKHEGTEKNSRLVISPSPHSRDVEMLSCRASNSEAKEKAISPKMMNQLVCRKIGMP